MEEAKEEILGNRENAEFIRGMVHAFREILDWEPEVTDKENVENEI